MITINELIDDVTIQIDETIETVTISVSEIGVQGIQGIQGAQGIQGIQGETGAAGVITLTTTGTSGAATLTGSALNIPQYSGGGGASVSDTAYDATSWDGVVDVAPSKNAVRDKIQSMGLQQITDINAFTTNPINVAVAGSLTGITGGSPNGQGINGYSDTGIGVDGFTTTGIAVNGYSEEGVAAQFETYSISANIVDFKSAGGLKAAVQNDGKITATAGTVSTDVVVKSQLDLKANDASVVHKTGNLSETIDGTKTFSSNIVIPGTGSALILSTTSGGTVSGLTTTTYPDLTELSYVKGVTSAIQTQLNAKQATISLTTSGTSGAATLVGSTLNIPQYSGATNLGYTAAPTNGTVTSSTGTSATLPLADATNAGLLKPAKFTVLENTSGTNTGDQNLSGYALLASPIFTGNPTATTQTALNNSTRLATTAYVEAACAVVAGASGVQVSSQDTFGTNKIATVTAAQYAAFVTAGTVSSTTLYFITA